jgi:7-carboxy-7-deazaguanine synthase
MSYAVKEIFYTLQGEGAQTGRPAVFCRFAGCNLWSGHERDRAAAVCKFCDTDFVGTNGSGGGKFELPQDLARAVAAAWPRLHDTAAKPYVVCTGGEPLLQMDDALVAALHAEGFEVAVETNGTQASPGALDWICVSPKANAEVVLRKGDELKLVYPQDDAPPERFTALDFKHFFLQPMDGPERDRNTKLALEYCLKHPQWKLSLQTHKLLGIP